MRMRRRPNAPTVLWLIAAALALLIAARLLG